MYIIIYWINKKCHCVFIFFSSFQKNLRSRKRLLIERIGFDYDVLFSSLFQSCCSAFIFISIPCQWCQSVRFKRKKKRDDVEIRFQYAKQFFSAFQILQKAKQSIHRFIFTVRSRSNPMKYNKFFQFNDFPCAPRFKANIAIEQWRGYQPNDRRVPFTKITPIFDKCFFFLFGWIFGSDDQTFAY